MGDYDIRAEDDVELSAEAERLLLAERDAEVAELRRQADVLVGLSAKQYLCRGLHSHGVESFELAGRMAKAGFTTIEYDAGKPGWRVHSRNSEYYVMPGNIAAVFARVEKAKPPERETPEAPTRGEQRGSGAEALDDSSCTIAEPRPAGKV